MSGSGALAERALAEPLELSENRVRRFYRGGALLEAFRGAASPADSDRPEDWVGSVTRAWRPAGTPAGDEGLGRFRLDEHEATVESLVTEFPEAVAGGDMIAAAGRTTGLLVKLLDSVMRLPVHCHPSRAFARRALGSFFGKTEAWIVLQTRQVRGEEPPGMRIGFHRDVTAQELREWIEQRDTHALLGAMHHREISAGDVWLVPAGLPHAIGAGTFLVELQEPSDFSIVAETAGYPVAPQDAHLGLGWDLMLDAFHRRGLSDADVDALRQGRGEAEPLGDGTTQWLFGTAADPYFRAARVRLRGTARLPFGETFVIGIVVAGSGTITGMSTTLELRRGSTFALPAAASQAVTLSAPDGLELLACLPPRPAALRG